MLRDRRKSLTLDHHKSPPLERIKGERRGSFAAPSSGSSTPPPHVSSNSLHPSSAEHPYKHERRGSLVSRWFKHISDAAEAYKTRDGKHRRQDPASQEDTLSHDKTKDEDSGSDLLSPPRANGAAAEDAQSPAGDTTPLPSTESTPQPSPGTPTPTPDPSCRKMGEGLSPSPVRRVTTADSSLIEPSEVLICQSPVLTAEPVLSPLEKLKRSDEVIRQVLEEKKRLVADILNVPADDFDNIAELAAEPSKDKEATEVVLAAFNQANKLTCLVNDALRVSEEVVGGVSALDSPAAARAPSVPASELHHITTCLNSQLSQLLDIMRARDEERERLRQEVVRSRELLHAMYERTSHDPVEVGAACSGMSKHVCVGAESAAEPAPVQIPTTPEVFVDALSGEAESQLEAAAATVVAE